MSETENLNDNNKNRIDVGQYLKELQKEGNVPDWVFERFPPEGNRGNYINESELIDRLETLFKGLIGADKLDVEGAEYIEEADLVLFRCQFLSEKEWEQIDEDNIYPQLPLFISETIVFDCPFCQYKHIHQATPEIILGGVSKYPCRCPVDYSPDDYLLSLSKKGYGIQYEKIHWARNQVEANIRGYTNESNSEYFIKDGLSYISITEMDLDK